MILYTTLQGLMGRKLLTEIGLWNFGIRTMSEPFASLVFTPPPADQLSVHASPESLKLHSRLTLVARLTGSPLGAHASRLTQSPLCLTVMTPLPPPAHLDAVASTRLQLALVTASREVKDVHKFFDHLVNIINIVVGSSKRNDELQHAQAKQVENMIASNEIETGRGANQIGTLQRAGDTRWGSHFQSICSLIKMFDATCKVINTISEEGANYKQRGDAEGAYQVLTSFEFILILHLMKEIMGITNILCQALQQHSQDLLNAMHLVSTTKSLIQKLRDDGWEPLLASVISFCEQHEIDIPDMNARYTKARGRYRRQDEDLTMEHHFRIGIFTVAIDFQLQELKSRFCELTTELVILSSALNPKDAFRLFKIVDICNLVKKYYPQDFTEQEQELLEFQL
ncbi:hypothetical protein SO802_020576 [Lithocarpus litseifolius]|uniref:Uncharacterized protein n=1 Tax=Lithocarpus litseifolius TaxID=425828 RepID=A0AAW2CFV1_9ROSI